MRLLAAFVLLAASSTCAQETAPIGSAEHVVLVSIDGLRPEFYLDRSWPLPNVQDMAKEGACAEAVRTVFPSVTYPSHTTLVTGALPARHGVFFNTPFEPGGETGRWHWEASAITAPTLWDALRSVKRRTAALSWPVTVGAPIDLLVPEVWVLGTEEESLARIVETSTPGLWATFEREATGRITPGRYGLETLERDDLTGAMGAWVLEHEKPALLALHLIQVDHWQHEEGRAPGKRLRAALGCVDRSIGRLLDAAERAGILGKTAFVVTGDHGFCDIHTQLRPNVWLVEAGLQAATKDRGAWRATFHAAGASAFLRLADPKDQDAVAKVRAALAAQPPGVRRLFRIVERDELARWGADPLAALALAPVAGVTFSSGAAAPAVRSASGGTHGYAADLPQIATGFVAWGAGVKAGARVHAMALEDVAPVIARLLGVPFAAPDGVAPEGVLAR